MEVYEYLDQVEKQIRQEAVREEIRTELRQHIEDQADIYQESGMSRKDAVEKAVEDMGDPVETGVQLDMVHQPQLDKKLIFAIGNAPTALVRLYELIGEGRIRPELIIGVPVGFVNVVQAKELILETDVPFIVARGRKGGSNIAACICNALLYML